MYRYYSALIVGLVAVLFAVPISAGDKKKKDEPSFPAVQLGPEHKVLETLQGVYDARVKLYLDPKKPASESTGIMTRRMIHGGNYLAESYQGTFFGKPFSGTGLVGFDMLKKKFVTTWIDSMSTSITVLHGTYDPIKKTLTNIGEDFTSEGKKMKARDVLRIINADEQLFQMYRQPDGEKDEFKVMEIAYKRAKK